MLSNNASREMEEYIKEEKKHPQKIYYMKKSKKFTQITNCINRNYPSYKVYYTIDQHHHVLSQFINNLKKYYEICEESFKSYFEAAISSEKSSSDKLIALKNNLKKLHPFFTYNDLLIRYIQEQIMHYFQASLDYYIWETYAKKIKLPPDNTIYTIIEEELKTLFFSLMKPTILSFSSVKKTSGSEKETENKLLKLWQEFCDYTKEFSFQEFIAIIKKTIQNITTNDFYVTKPEIHPLNSLYKVHQMITSYTDFSNLIINVPAITKAQALCLYLSRPESTSAISSLKEQKIISTLEEIYSILINDLKTELQGDITYINDDDSLFENTNEDIYKILHEILENLDKNRVPQLQKELQDILNSLFSPNQDAIFEMEIHEFYYFEQLIYMEILEMIIDHYFILQCKRTDCHTYYISKDRKQKYCQDCSSKRSTADQTYRENRSKIEKVRIKKYQQKYYHIKKLNGQNDEFAKNSLKEWCKQSHELVQKYKASHRENDTDNFIIDLNKLDD